MTPTQTSSSPADPASERGPQQPLPAPPCCWQGRRSPSSSVKVSRLHPGWPPGAPGPEMGGWTLFYYSPNLGPQEQVVGGMLHASESGYFKASSNHKYWKEPARNGRGRTLFTSLAWSMPCRSSETWPKVSLAACRVAFKVALSWDSSCFHCLKQNCRRGGIRCNKALSTTGQKG